MQTVLFKITQLIILITRVKHPDKIMVWSVISGRGTGRLQICKGLMDQHQYNSILESRLLPQIQDWFPNSENIYFMQDSAPLHTTKSVKAFLNINQILLLPWLGNSSDLNPIENLWELAKRRVNRGPVITTKVQLIRTERLKAVWHRDEELQIIAQKCIQSMPDRIRAVIKAKGGPTKY